MKSTAVPAAPPDYNNKNKIKAKEQRDCNTQLLMTSNKYSCPYHVVLQHNLKLGGRERDTTRQN